MDTSILVVVFLLLTASSVASYLLSQWTSVRNGKLGIGWVAISLGITLLLGAAAIVVLVVGLLPSLGLSTNIESAEQMRKSAESGHGAAERVPGGQETSNDAPKERGARPAAGRNITEGHAEHRSGIETSSAQSSVQRSGAPWEGKSGTARQSVGPIFKESDPWGATNCVSAFNRDPADLTRWTIENDCGAPVGVVFASCSKTPPDCSGSQSTSWEYPSEGMILPGKAQRSVTDAEETQYGRQIRYVACMVATPVAIELIGQSSESRSSPSWLEQFDAARNGDECLMRVQQWSDAGRSSGQSIDVLLGGNAPGKVHPGSASEL